MADILIFRIRLAENLFLLIFLRFGGPNYSSENGLEYNTLCQLSFMWFLEIEGLTDNRLTGLVRRSVEKIEDKIGEFSRDPACRGRIHCYPFVPQGDVQACAVRALMVDGSDEDAGARLKKWPCLCTYSDDDNFLKKYPR